MKQWIFRWGPAILIMGLIFIASSTPGSDLPDFGYLDFLSKKVGHLIGYGLLGAALFHGMSRNGSITRSGVITAGIVIILYAVSDEWHQSFIPYRHSSLQDICINIVGGFLGMGFLHQFRKQYHRLARDEEQPGIPKNSFRNKDS